MRLRATTPSPALAQQVTSAPGNGRHSLLSTTGRLFQSSVLSKSRDIRREGPGGIPVGLDL